MRGGRAFTSGGGTSSMEEERGGMWLDLHGAMVDGFGGGLVRDEGD